MSQVPSCLRNALLGGAGLWPQPSPCLPAKGLLCALPQSSSTTLFPPGGLARVSPAHLCLGPTWQVPVHLGLHALARLLAGSAIHSRTQSAGCFTGNYYVTGLELATVSSSWGSHGLWLRSWGVKEITSVNGGQPILSKETEGMLLVSSSSRRASFLGPGPFKMTTPDSEPHPPASLTPGSGAQWLNAPAQGGAWWQPLAGTPSASPQTCTHRQEQLHAGSVDSGGQGPPAPRDREGPEPGNGRGLLPLSRCEVIYGGEKPSLLCASHLQEGLFGF